MEDSHNSNASWNKNFTDAYNDTENSYNEGSDLLFQFIDVVHWITICGGLPLILVALFMVSSMVKKDHVAPVYIFSFLISDLIQLCSRIPLTLHNYNDFSVITYFFGLIANVGFMVCVSLERYLVIAKPLWYRFRRNIKTSVVVCVVVWNLSLLFILTSFFLNMSATILCVFLLLPLPLFIFCLVGSIKALSEARSVPADEKRRIVSILVMVLLIYAMLFLPIIIFLLLEEAKKTEIFNIVAAICVFLSPLADSAMCIVLRKSAVDKLLASMCCCKMTKDQEINTTDIEVSALCKEAV